MWDYFRGNFLINDRLKEFSRRYSFYAHSLRIWCPDILKPPGKKQENAKTNEEKARKQRRKAAASEPTPPLFWAKDVKSGVTPFSQNLNGMYK